MVRCDGKVILEDEEFIGYLDTEKEYQTVVDRIDAFMRWLRERYPAVIDEYLQAKDNLTEEVV